MFSKPGTGHGNGAPLFPIDELTLTFERYDTALFYDGDIRIADTPHNNKIIDAAVAAGVNRRVSRMKPVFEDFIRRIRALLAAPSSSVTVTEIPMFDNTLPYSSPARISTSFNASLR